MRCPFCGKSFDEDEARKECAANCSLLGGCKKLKCPHCGYETPATPRWIRWLRKKVRKHDD